MSSNGRRHARREVVSRRRPSGAYDVLTSGALTVVRAYLGPAYDAVPVELLPHTLRTPNHRIGSMALAVSVKLIKQPITGGAAAESYEVTRYNIEPYEPTPLWTGFEWWHGRVVTCNRAGRMEYSETDALVSPTGAEILLDEIDVASLGEDAPLWAALQKIDERGDSWDIRTVRDGLERTLLSLRDAPPTGQVMLD